MSLGRRIALILLCALTCVATLTVYAEGDDSSEASAEAATEMTSPGSGMRRQVSPAARLSTLFPTAVQISFAVAVVPDPIVPRYRRPYDLDIVALELGMLREGYVLDRFYLPWNEELRNEATRRVSTAGSSRGPTAAPVEQPPMSYRYGLMIFRCDGWRARQTAHLDNSTDPGEASVACGAHVSGAATRGSRIRALYIVTDTATKGVESEALLCAINRINSQLLPGTSGGKADARPSSGCWDWRQGETYVSAGAGAPVPRTALLAYPGACRSLAPLPTLLVLGPNFSGSVDSAGEVGQRLRAALHQDPQAQPIKAMCLLSSSATDPTNSQANDLWSDVPFPVRYESLAVENDRKLLDVARLLPALIGEVTTADASAAARSSSARRTSGASSRSSPVAILAESSTYGYGVCEYADDRDHSMLPDVRRLCLSARRLYFTANIADVHHGMQQTQQQRARNNPLKREMPSGHLSLDLGAENGSEYPESRESASTSVGVQLALEQVLEQLQEDPPRLVIVIATDVRDRLFLFEELRRRLTRALLIDFESDNLISHPDFLHASRGALAMGSASLTSEEHMYGCESKLVASVSQMTSTWSTDFQAILADAVSRLYDPASERPRAPCDPPSPRARQPVLQIISLEGLQSVTRDRSDGQTVEEGESGLLHTTLGRAEISAPFFCLGIASLFIGPLVLPHLRPHRLTRRRNSWMESVASGVCLPFLVWAFLVARLLHERDHDNPMFVVTLIFLCVASWGLVVCIRCLRQATGTAPPTNPRNLIGPALLALAAVCFATMPSLWYATVKNSGDYLIALDVPKLESIALDPAPGLAFLLLVALATVALLYSCGVLATSAAVVNRNSALLRGDRAAGDVEHQHRGDLRGALNLNPFNVFALGALVTVAIVLPHLLFDDIRLTVFGRRASQFALLALMATSICATLLWACSLGMARRISALSRYLTIARKQPRDEVFHEATDKSPRDARQSDEETVDRWPLDLNGPRVFPPTPVLARAADGGVATKQLLRAADLSQWRERISEWLHYGQNDGAHRAAVFALLATEISVFRWCMLVSVFCALGSIGAVYLFPIEADPLLLFNLLLLVAIGATAGLAATTFERDALLSSVLCNRSAPRRFSIPLFVFISVPFVALGLFLAIAQIPGVVDWGGGVLQLLGALGLHP